MKNGYQLLKLLTNKLNENEVLINKLTSMDKEAFINDDESIAIAVGLLNELGEIISSIDKEVFILSKRLYDLLSPFNDYCYTIINKYGFVNTLKLYDILKIDVKNLTNILNDIKKG